MIISTIKKGVFIILLLNIFILNVQAEDEKQSAVDSTSTILNSGQIDLINLINNKNYEVATETYFHLQTVAIENGFLAFTYTDILYITLLNHQWNEFFDYVKNYDQKTVLPVYNYDDQISRQLYNLTVKNSSSILKAARIKQSDDETSPLSDEQILVIKTFLHVVEEEELEEEYSDYISEFKSKHPSSEYSEFVNNFLPAIQMEASWFWTIGPSVFVPQQRLGDNFSPTVGISLSFDFNIGKIYGSLFMDGCTLSAKDDLTIGSTTFREDDLFSYFDTGLQLGYFIYNNDQIHLAPYATIAGSFLESMMYNNNYNDSEYQLFNTFTGGIGIHSLFKIYEFKSHYILDYGYGYYSNEPINSYLAFKVNIGYNLLANSNYTLAKGNILYSQICLVWGFGDF